MIAKRNLQGLINEGTFDFDSIRLAATEQSFEGSSDDK